MNAQSLVLRALRSIHESGVSPSWPRLFAVVPLDQAVVRDAVVALDQAGLVDGEALRLTLLGFASAHAPRVLVHERRRHPRLRKAAFVA